MTNRYGGQSIAQALSFIRILEGDLKGISSEAKKKAPEVKEAAELGLLKLKEIDLSAEEISGGKEDAGEDDEEWGSRALTQALSTAEEISLAFIAACDPSVPKVNLQALGGIHKMVMHSAIPPDLLTDLFTALEKLVEPTTDQNVLLKVLEALLSLLTSRYFQQHLTQSMQRMGLSMLLNLSNIGEDLSSSPVQTIATIAIVRKQTSEVAFRQVCSEIFFHASEAAEADSEKDAVDGQSPVKLGSSSVGDLPEAVACAYLLFRDLCALVNGDACTWLGVESIRLGLVLEVVEEVLRGDLFQSSKRIRSLLTSRLCPALHERLNSTASTATYALLLRIVFLLVVNFLDDLQADMEVMLFLLVKTVEDPDSMGECSSALHRVLALEALRCTFSHHDGEVIQGLNRAFDSTSGATGIVKSTFEVASQLAKGNTLDVSPGSLAMLEGSAAPFSSTLLKDEDTEKTLSIISLSLCRASLRAMTAMAAQDEYAAVLLGLSWKHLTTSLMQVLRPDGKEEANHARAVTFVSEPLVKLVGLDVGHEVVRARGYVAESLCSVCDAQLRSGKPMVTLNVFESLFAVVINCRPALQENWSDVVAVCDRLDSALQSSKALTALEEPLNAFHKSVLDLPLQSKRGFVEALVGTSRNTYRNTSEKESSEMSLQPLVRIRDFLLGLIEGKDAMEEGVWDLVLGHLVSLVRDHVDPSLRQLALKYIHQLQLAALGVVDESLLPHGKVPQIPSSQIYPLDPFSHAYVTGQVIVPMKDLMIATSHDTRVGVIEKLRVILETKGELVHGHEAWENIVAVLRIAVEKGGDVQVANEEVEPKSSAPDETDKASLMHLGFRAVQLIATDFLQVMSFSVVGSFIDVLGLYGTQNEDVNTALTSVSLLWGVADFLSKSEQTTTQDTLWLAIFTWLKHLGLDGRPELRNGAIKSLISTLLAHGTVLSPKAWAGCLTDCLDPLIKEVMVGGLNEEASSVEAPADTNSASDGNTRIIIHHSRDTPEKQWDETRNLMLSSMARLLKRFSDRLIETVQFDVLARTWLSSLEASSKCAAADPKAKEIATSGVDAMLDILKTAALLGIDESGQIRKESAEELEVKERLWNAAWQSIDGCVWTSDEPEKKFISNGHALLRLCKGLARVWSDIFEFRSSGDALNIVNVLVRIAQQEVAETHTIEIRNAALDSIAQLKFLVSEVEAWTSLVKEMLRLLLSKQSDPLADELAKRRVLLTLQAQYKGSELPQQVKIDELEDVVGSIFPLMLARTEYVQASITAAKENRAVVPPSRLTSRVAGELHLELDKPVWAVAVDTFQVAVDAGCGEGGAYKGSVWPVLVQSFEQFLLSKSGAPVRGISNPGARVAFTMKEFEDSQRSLHAKVYRLVQEYDEALVETVRVCLQRSEGVEEVFRQRMLRILTEGATQGQNRSQFARACQAVLFSLASGSSGSDGSLNSVELEAQASLSSVCEAVLRSYVRDGRRSGKCPLPASRRAEVLHLLNQLHALRVDTSDGNPRGGSQRHIVDLYPTICQCVEIDDADVRTLTRALLLEAGGALGVRQP
ncbi:hypothetical protein NDN08_003090 [Rhodosorus marinus]|uniref:Protein MON2 homolog n=1 Tax=Rhodosorus marinus TaxID=101924 RepID=A0AAV8V028_9RHOD|nr:hypothetical protein NDN08_003090 [Rhodosorus marinus]